LLTTRQEDRLRYSQRHVVSYSITRIDAAANLIIATMLTLLFVAPISLLYYISTSTSGVRRAVASIGVLMFFTLVFTVLTTVFTRAKRHEVTGAAAAYVYSCDT
jgi:ABC-type transport system involved in cytochrome bd biosynthesis fused ATPase/permease subunit